VTGVQMTFYCGGASSWVFAFDDASDGFSHSFSIYSLFTDSSNYEGIYIADQSSTNFDALLHPFSGGTGSDNKGITLMPLGTGLVGISKATDVTIRATFDPGALTVARNFTWPNATGDVAVIAAAGFPARTAAATWAARTITAALGGTVTNGDGVSGNPTVGPDLATTPQKASGTADHSATCGDTGDPFQIGDTYQETDTGEACTCTGIDLWSCLASETALTANLPVIGGGAGVAPSVGTRSGNTTAYVTTTGTQTSGDCVKIDSSGNHIANGSACGGGGLPAVDTTSIVEGSADGTKEIRFEVDGLTAGTVRVLTPPNADTVLAGQNFANQFSADQNLGWTGSDYAELQLNGGSDGVISSRPESSPDLAYLAAGATSNAWHIARVADRFENFGNGFCGGSACTHPTLFFHLSGSDATQYLGLSYYGTSGKTIKTLTESSATTLIRIPVASGDGAGGQLFYTVFASDATNHQIRSGSITFAVVNKAGTETCTVNGVDSSFTANPSETQDGSAAGAMSSGTLTYAWSVDTAATNACDLKLNAVSSLTQTTLEIRYRLQNMGASEPLPQ
jgi:hypothetical protein